MHHLFKDNACDQQINSSYEQLSSERPSALWSLCETNRWFHKCEQTKRSILWDMSQCQITAWRLMATPVSAFVCSVEWKTMSKWYARQYDPAKIEGLIGLYKWIYNVHTHLINRVDRTESQHIQKLCYHQYRFGWYSLLLYESSAFSDLVFGSARPLGDPCGSTSHISAGRLLTVFDS